MLLSDRLLYVLKQSPLKFQLHLTKTLTTAGYAHSINDACLFYKLRGIKFSYVSTYSDDLLHCGNCQAMVNEFKQQLITIYSDIQCHNNAKSYIGMAITRSPDLSQIYISQKSLATRIISDFLPEPHPQLHTISLIMCKPYDRIKF